MSKLRYWLPTLAWMGIIFIFSSHPTITTTGIHWQDFILKKTAHVVEYFVLSWLVFSSLRNSTHWSTPQVSAVALLVAIVYAVSDEYHQSFVPGREPHVRDVVIDSWGIVAAQAVRLLQRRKVQI